MKRRVYLDFASATPVTKAAQRAFEAALSVFGNPSSPHAEGRVALELLEAARTRIARLAGVKSEAVLFTSGATEANNLLIRGVIEARHKAGAPYASMHVLYSPAGHASTVHAVEALNAQGVATEALPLMHGHIDVNALATMVSKKTVLVVMDAVCGESGTRFDTRAVARTVHELQPHVVVHVDASQLPLVESFERMRLGADTLALDASKAGGVRGIGVLIRPAHVTLAPLMHGGAQEWGMRPGTQPTALAHAFAAALAYAEQERQGFSARAATLRVYLENEIAQLPYAYVYTCATMTPHIVNVSFPGRDTDYLAALLDARGIAVSTKSACETDSVGSRVMLLLTGDDARAAATLRISFGHASTLADVRLFMRELTSALAFLDAQTL